MRRFTVHIVSFILFACFFANSAIVAQPTKREVEKSIKREEMPPDALLLLEFFAESPESGEYYFETDGDVSSYEAKLKRNEHVFSLEFDTAGVLLDIEERIEFEEINDSVRSLIKDTLDNRYSRYSITRVQRQYTADDHSAFGHVVIQRLLNREFDKMLIRYELEIEAERGNELGPFEILFDSDGDIVQIRRIIRRSLDNVW